MLKITEDCINCNACIDECPNNAVYAPGDSYELNGQTMPALSDDYTFIVPELCKLCEGYSDSPSCQGVCPTDSIVEADSLIMN